MKSTFAAILAFCLSSANGAAVEHIQNSKELTIPRGTYSQFRIIGEGLNDANLAGDITSVSYSMKLTALKEHIAELRKDKTGAATPFDLYFLTEKDDYACYIEKVTKFIEYGGIAETCDFVKPENKKIKESITVYESKDESLLKFDKTHSDAFLVIDNSGWLAATQGMKPNGKVGDVFLNMEITTVYSANNWYESLYKFFIIGISSVSAMIFIMLICYCCATKKFNRVMNEQKEFKKQQLLKQGNGENPSALFSN